MSGGRRQKMDSITKSITVLGKGLAVDLQMTYCYNSATLTFLWGLAKRLSHPELGQGRTAETGLSLCPHPITDTVSLNQQLTLERGTLLQERFDFL
jgi:hypothetical protein